LWKRLSEFEAPSEFRYLNVTPFDINSAVDILHKTCTNVFYRPSPSTNYGIVERSDLGRRTEAWIVANNPDFELNIWHEAELCEQLLKK
jgi:hypothetical protein